MSETTPTEPTVPHPPRYWWLKRLALLGVVVIAGIVCLRGESRRESWTAQLRSCARGASAQAVLGADVALECAQVVAAARTVQLVFDGGLRRFGCAEADAR